MAYRCAAVSIAGFVQQLAVGYIAHRYFFYSRGRIPDHKDPEVTDRKIIAQYAVDMSRWSRCRRRKAGEAGVQYLRYGRFYVILATHGQHPFFTAEGAQVRDFRRQPLYFMGYSIGCRRARGRGIYHASVRIERDVFAELKVQFERQATRRSIEQIVADLRALPYEMYAPVRNQLRVLLRAVNHRRKAAGLELVPGEVLCWRRGPVKPFAECACPEIGTSRKTVVRNRPWPSLVFDE